MKHEVLSKLFLFKLAVSVFLLLPSPSKALDFTLNVHRFSIIEVDIGKQIGCHPDRITTVVLKNSEGKQLWATYSIEEASRDLTFQGECVGGQVSEIQGIWAQSNWVHFFLTSYNIGAHKCCETVTGYQFDGERITEVFDVPGTEKVDVRVNPPFITVAYYSLGEECNACPHKWVRDTFKWDRDEYKRIKTETALSETYDSPWTESPEYYEAVEVTEKEGQENVSAVAVEEKRIESKEELISSYNDKLYEEIYRNWELPDNIPSDRLLKTRIVFKVDENGQVYDVKVKESSGSIQFDNSGVIAIYKSAPLTLPPPEILERVKTKGLDTIFQLALSPYSATLTITEQKQKN